ncbi:MAG: hypothetical protein U5K54_26695 [Cytophagales bacterium]|nr:hypothetical protein [Cytophagales bacterium]
MSLDKYNWQWTSANAILPLRGTVVITDNQVEGRGQRGSTWSSEPHKNLTLSLNFKTNFLEAN